MYLTHLSLTNFRSFARLDLDVPRRVVLLVGSNAQGKTSLLEAVYFLAAFTFDRKVNRNGQVTLKGIHYTVGLTHKEKQIQVRFDPSSHEWIFLETDARGLLLELRRQPLVGIDFTTLTGLHMPEPPTSLPAVQLHLPLTI